MQASVAGNRHQEPGRGQLRQRGGRVATALTLALALIAGAAPRAAAQPASLDPQPAKAPTPAPATPGAPTPTPPGDKPAGTPGSTKPVESVDNNQTLGNDADDRPWVAGVSDANQEAALKLFREGNSSLNEGVFVTAVKHYRKALEHWDHPAIHYNLALALMNLDQPIEVYQSLGKALKYDPKAGPAPLDNDKYDRAKNYMLLAQKQVANVDITCDKPGAKVSVDGNVVFTGPGRYQGMVRIGKHSFVAEKAGYVTSVEAPYIGPGETMRFSLKLFSAEELTRYKRRWDATWMPWTVGAAGGAIAIAAGVLLVSGRSDIDEFDARITECGTAGCEITPELEDMKSSGETKQTLAWVGFGVGAATIGAGALLLYMNRVRPYQIRPEEIKPTPGSPTVSSSLRLTPIVGPNVAGASASFRF
jgi:tetratricopeptide (TPR) repeat protein